VFAGVVVLDGVLFPSATRLLEPGLSAAIAGSVERKVLLAVLYAAPLLAFVLIYRGAMERYRDAPLRVREVLFAPKQHLVRELEQQEHERIQLLERVARVAEEERQRLAEDLHDDAIQLLTAADIRLQTTMRDAPDADLEPARRLILEQRGPDVTADSFADLVGAYADRLLPADGVELDIDVQLPDDVPPEVIAAAYRIVLEALSNVARHAGAGTASVTVTGREDLLVGAVTDDGVGIPVDAETGPGHLGLRAMRDRAAMVGGRVTVTPADGGTVVSFELPLR
jgi:signal transduction histidine kinase